MEDILSFALYGIYTLLLLSLTFNFLLTIRLRGMHSRIAEAEKQSTEEARLMHERLLKVKNEILHRKGMVM